MTCGMVDDAAVWPWQHSLNPLSHPVSGVIREERQLSLDRIILNTPTRWFSQTDSIRQNLPRYTIPMVFRALEVCSRIVCSSYYKWTFFNSLPLFCPPTSALYLFSSTCGFQRLPSIFDINITGVQPSRYLLCQFDDVCRCTSWPSSNDIRARQNW